MRRRRVARKPVTRLAHHPVRRRVRPVHLRRDQVMHGGRRARSSTALNAQVGHGVLGQRRLQPRRQAQRGEDHTVHTARHDRGQQAAAPSFAGVHRQQSATVSVRGARTACAAPQVARSPPFAMGCALLRRACIRHGRIRTRSRGQKHRSEPAHETRRRWRRGPRCNSSSSPPCS